MSNAVAEPTPPRKPAEAPDLRALTELTIQLDHCSAELGRARARATELLAQRRGGQPWAEIVAGEERPLVVESISAVLSSLATAGHDFRRQQALALQAEGVSINRIAAMYGVTRQRISTLLRETDAGDGD